MPDGSMILTREESWKEIKLGRIFLGSQNIEIQENRKLIARSIYVSHLGNAYDFFIKLERHLIHYKNKVIIGDGAKWIWNWAEDNYPGAVQILDFYHAIEKLWQYALLQFPQKEIRAKWMEEQKQKLLENQVEKIIEELMGMRSKNKDANKRKWEVMNYYEDNIDRMLYKEYRDKGLLIGSGPIESAHRNVIQQRMKLAGQRWSKKGAQSIVNLRCLKKGGNWQFVTDIIKKAS